MKKTTLAAVATAVAFAAGTQSVSAAKGPEYSFAELGYIHANSDVADGDGFGVNIMYGATDMIFLKMGYANLSLDSKNTPDHADLGRFQIGGGAHFALTDSIDALGSVSYVNAEFTGIKPSFAEDGYLVEAGVRAMVSKDLELNATISQLHLDTDDTGFGVGAVYSFAKDFSASGSYRQFQDDSEGEFFAGVRLSF